MITTEEYMKAHAVINQYVQEQKEISDKKEKDRLSEIKKKQDECGEHYYLDVGKYSSSKRCQFCGKELN